MWTDERGDEAGKGRRERERKEARRAIRRGEKGELIGWKRLARRGGARHEIRVGTERLSAAALMDDLKGGDEEEGSGRRKEALRGRTRRVYRGDSAK